MDNKLKKRLYSEAYIKIISFDSADILTVSEDNDGEYPDSWWLQ